MAGLSMNDKLVLLQYAIDKYDSENVLKEKLKDTLPAKDIERTIDTLIGTQKVRRIGADVLQNNVSHTGELPELPDHLKAIVENL
jgi:propanediol dehydratase small subunit